MYVYCYILKLYDKHKCQNIILRSEVYMCTDLSRMHLAIKKNICSNGGICCFNLNRIDEKGLMTCIIKGFWVYVTEMYLGFFKGHKFKEAYLIKQTLLSGLLRDSLFLRCTVRMSTL